jgi:hypothetical protein
MRGFDLGAAFTTGTLDQLHWISPDWQVSKEHRRVVQDAQHAFQVFPTFLGVKHTLRILQFLQPKFHFVRVQWEYALAPIGPHDLQLSLVPAIGGVTDWHTFSYIPIRHSIQRYRFPFWRSENPIPDRNSGFLGLGLRGVPLFRADGLGFASAIRIGITE